MGATPTDDVILLNLARAYIENEQKAEAEVILNQVIKLNGSNWEAWDKLAHVQFALGKPEDARASVETLLERNPSYPGKAELEQLIR